MSTRRPVVSPAGARQRLLELLAEQRAVGQVGQRIVLRHVGDLGFRALPLGHVEMGRDPAAARHRLAGDADQAAVGELVDPARRRVGRQRAQRDNDPLGGAVVGLALEDAVDDTVPDDVADAACRVSPARAAAGTVSA